MPSARHRLKVRRTQNTTRNNRSSKGNFKKVILFVCISFLLYFFWNLYHSWKNSQWISGTRITVAVGSENPKIYSFNPQAEKLNIMTIPANTQVQASRGYGDWFVGSLWKLGGQEKLEGQLLAESLQKSFGLPVDAWIEEKGESLFASRQLGFVSAFIEALASTSIKTNLTFFDRLQLLVQVGSVSVSGRREMDLSSLGIIKNQKLADGEDGYVVIPEKAKIAFEGMKDDLVFAESKKLKIYNATDKSGLASGVTNIITTLGLRVIGTGTTDDKVKDCEVRGESKEISSLSARRLAAVLGCSLNNKDSGGPEDIELWLGESFSKRF